MAETHSILELFRSWFLAEHCYTLFLVFARLSAVIALMPGIGEQFVPPRVKLVIAIVLSFLLQPVIAPVATSIPQTAGMLQALAGEFLIGTLFGLWVRILYLSLTIAAGFCSQTLGITNIFDGILEPGGAPALSGFFSFTAIAIMSVTGGHYFILQAYVKTYDMIPLLGTFPMGQASLSIVEAGVAALNLGLRLALPFLVIGFLVNIALGFVNRAMPQIPVFFVGQPLMIGIGFMLMSFLLPMMFLNWGEAMRAFLVEQL